MPKQTPRNLRGAGRKPTGGVTLAIKVSVWLDDLPAFQKLSNKARFVREAIREKLERDREANQK